ncbi:hypothetical protein AJ80_01897 [Polytolypa hystricis UAMH7299]|uniref:C6 finger domain transcription factor nscR n=1 Tax=Polytolypa hystricis (strain UAMH7299) TaxID=1447883 RepID=A0A2B7YZI6_POLH7|nr:hypothetical protein AJ80_01897 [Polytolypa hystricis UAMH7299]
MSGTSFGIPLSAPSEGQYTSTPPVPQAKPPRILACVLCQQRKVRCDRKNPCSNCIKAKVDCVTLPVAPRRRRRRPPEKDLLDRLKKYEDLLKQHGVQFEPMSGSSGGGGGTSAQKETDLLLQGTRTSALQETSDGECEYRKMKKSSSLSADTESTGNIGPWVVSFTPTFMLYWSDFVEQFRDPKQIGDSSDDEAIEPTMIHNAWDQLYDNNDHILFSSGVSLKTLRSLHPDPVKIFQLWQIYLNNANPLLRIVHAPLLQQQIIEASSNLDGISAALEVLMFGIYCSAIMTLSDEDCLQIFGESRDSLCLKYQSGCQQALVNAGFMRTFDLRVLSALFLYLVSKMDPRSLSVMVGIALRVAQRMGLHGETYLKELPPFEAELRRRLWWQIAMLDSRMSELADARTSVLAPVWDCNKPLNINDSDLFPHTRDPAVPKDGPTELIFVVLIAELGDFVRRERFHLRFYSPFLSCLGRDRNNSTYTFVMDEFEETIENKYLKYLDPQIPLHLMSLCVIRGLIGKWRFIEYTSRSVNKQLTQPASIYHERAFTNALRMIELNTVINSNPLIKGFRWFTHYNFPFPAFVYIIQELRRTTTGPRAEKAWDTLAANINIHHSLKGWISSVLFRPFSTMIFKAWEAHVNALRELGETVPPPPDFITTFKEYVAADKRPNDLTSLSLNADPTGGTDSSSFLPSIGPTGAALSHLFAITESASRGVAASSSSSSFAGPAPAAAASASAPAVDPELNELNIDPTDWNFMNTWMGNSMSNPGLFFGGNQDFGTTNFGAWE